MRLWAASGSGPAVKDRLFDDNPHNLVPGPALGHDHGFWVEIEK